MSIIYRALKKLQSDRELAEAGPVTPTQNSGGEDPAGQTDGSNKRTLILLGAAILALLLAAAGLKLVEIASEEPPKPPPGPSRPLPPAVAPVTPKPAAALPTPEREPESGDSPEPASAMDTTAATPVTVLPAAKPALAAPAAVTEQRPALAQTAPPAIEEAEDGGSLPLVEETSSQEQPPEPLLLDETLSSDPNMDPDYGKYQRSSKKQAATALAAARLQQAIRSSDTAGANRALEELARLKGRDSVYFLQMQAYWYLHSQRYDDAERVLIQVLHKNPNSLHAGLNMAVLESLTGRETAARDRLQALATRFPDDPEVKALLRRLD